MPFVAVAREWPLQLAFDDMRALATAALVATTLVVVPCAHAERPPGCPPAQVHFAFDSAELTAADIETLDRVAECLAADPRRRVEITGGADERGDREYNRRLGARRAESVARYLTEKGIRSTQHQ